MVNCRLQMEYVALLPLLPVEVKQHILAELLLDAAKVGLHLSTTGLTLDDAIVFVAMTLESHVETRAAVPEKVHEDGQFDDAE